MTAEIQLRLLLPPALPGPDWRDQEPYRSEPERIPDGRRKVYPARIVVDGRVCAPQGWDDDGEPVYREVQP